MKNRLADRNFWIAVLIGGLGGLLVGVAGVEIPFYGWILIWVLLFLGLLVFSFIKAMSPVWLMSKGQYDRAITMMTKQLNQKSINPVIKMGILYNMACATSRKGDFQESDKWLDLLLKDHKADLSADLSLLGVIYMLRANNLFLSTLKLGAPADQNRLDDETWHAFQALFTEVEDVGRWMEFLPMVTAIEARRAEAAAEDIHVMLATYIHGIQPRKWVKTPGQMPLLFDEMTYAVINPFFIAIALLMVEQEEEARRWMEQAASSKYENIYRSEARKWLG